MGHLKKIICAAIPALSALASLSSVVGIAHAETQVDYGYFVAGNTFWTAAGSPYILEDDINVMVGASLTVGPDVTILPSPSMDYKPSIYVNGSLSLNGTAGHNIKISGIAGITIDHGSTSISYGDISADNGISFIGATGTISTSTISNGSQGIYSEDSSLDIQGSRITNNTYGIVVVPVPDIFFGKKDDELYGKGGVGNALDVVSSTSVTIVNSAIMNNSQAAVSNSDTLTVLAENNWWGSVDGPLAASSSRIIGQVDYEPWLDHDPTVPVQPCCSSVLFIPGLEGSRLYLAPFPVADPGETARKLWEPLSNIQVSGLSMDTDGSSTNSVYSGQPIDSAFGLDDVYGRFMDYLDGLVEDGTIGEWKSFGYDWRQPISDVVLGREQRATTTDSLIDIVEGLAARSKTGKVTLVAHSNGGLIAKYLVKALDELGEKNIVDKVISVGVPYLGTPEAISRLLHGDDTSIAYGLILKPSVARGLTQNMPSVYPLLPSRRYFSETKDLVISFAAPKIARVNDGAYPQAISTFDGQEKFIGDPHNDQSSSFFSDTSMPIEGNGLLMDEAADLHDALDGYSWPEGVAGWAIVGWDMPTAKGIFYYETAGCHLPLVQAFCPGHKALNTRMGDGTVVAKSAAFGASAGSIVSLDLEKIGKAEKTAVAHENLLESPTTQAVIRDILKGDLVQSAPLPAGAAFGAPEYDNEPESLVISTHSPVELHVYDTNGNHTGLVPIPSGLGAEDGLYSMYEEKIPGSSLSMTGDDGDSGDGKETYVDLPYEDNDYTVVVKGIGSGTFSLDIERVQNGIALDSVEFDNVPVTPATIATTSVSIQTMPHDSNDCAPFIPALASSTLPLNVDFNGDGSTEVVVEP